MKVANTCFPAGTSIVCIGVFAAVISRPATGVSSTPPPSLPMISLVIANLNPRNLVQLFGAFVKVIIAHDRIRNVHRCALSRKKRVPGMNQIPQRL